MRKVSILFVSIVLLSVSPLRSNAQDNSCYFFVRLMDSDTHPYSFEHMQENAPQGYVCGYVVNDNRGDRKYSMFLVKKKKKFELILNAGDNSEVRKVSKKLASQLEETVYNRFVDAEKDKNGPFEVTIDDVNYNSFFTIIPSKITEYWSDVSMLIPDSLWREEYLKFRIVSL